MKKLSGIAIGDAMITVVLVVLIQHGTIAMYPTGLVMVALMFICNTWLLKRGFITSSDDASKLDKIGGRGANRLLWVLSAGIIIALLVAVTRRDSRYLAQVVIGLLLLGYILYALRLFKNKNRKKQNL